MRPTEFEPKNYLRTKCIVSDIRYIQYIVSWCWQNTCVVYVTFLEKRFCTLFAKIEHVRVDGVFLKITGVTDSKRWLLSCRVASEAQRSIPCSPTPIPVTHKKRKMRTRLEKLMQHNHRIWSSIASTKEADCIRVKSLADDFMIRWRWN